MYYRYVDDSFAIFDSENDCDEFLYQSNSLHSSLRFTIEKEVNRSFPFLDVQMEKVGSKLITSVYRKPRDEKFTILSSGRSSFHLSTLEAVDIKSCKPNLYHQKEFVYNLKLLR